MSNNGQEDRLNTDQPTRKRGWNLGPYKWPKGYCPNPGGRGKGNVSLKEALLARLRKHPEDLTAVVDMLLSRASSGDTRSISLIYEMTDQPAAAVSAVQVNVLAERNGQFGFDEPSREECDQILVARVVDLAYVEPGRLRAAVTAEERAIVISALTEPANEPSGA